jgi:hypothetical protein
MTESEAQPQGAELLPSPFCGEPPFCKLIESGTVAAETSYSGTAIDVRVYELGCINDLCAVCPNVTGGLAGVKTLWNTRADLPRATADERLLTALKAAANYICRARSDHYDAKTRDTVIKALTYEINKLERAPRATGETTIEACLAELRKLVNRDDDIEFKVSLDSGGHRCYWLDVNQAPLTNADSYQELIEKVRAWAKSRAAA